MGVIKRIDSIQAVERFHLKCGLEMEPKGGPMDVQYKSRPHCLFDPFPKQRKQMQFSILLTLLVSLVSVQATPFDFAALREEIDLD